MPNATYSQLRWLCRLLAIVLLPLSVPSSYSQQTSPPTKALTLDEAVNFGLSHDLKHRVAVWQDYALNLVRNRRRILCEKSGLQNEAIVDTYEPEEQALGWYYYRENQIKFPFMARCIASKGVLC